MLAMNQRYWMVDRNSDGWHSKIVNEPQTSIWLLTVVSAAGENINVALFNAVDDAIFLINPT